MDTENILRSIYINKNSFEPDNELQEKRSERRKTLLKRVLLPIEKALDSK